jgi:ankyrin repeat protein
MYIYQYHAVESLLSRVSFDSDGDSALHVAAAGGDSEQYLKCAEIIYNSAKDLLDATNKNGDTPLHCAARAGNTRMVSRLMELAASENDDRGASRVKELLRRENKIGETALHEAIRNGSTEIVTRLISEDPELAAVPRVGGGASALYLAVSSRRWDVVDELFSRCSGLSYAGPDGQNILHIGVLRGKGT